MGTEPKQAGGTVLEAEPQAQEEKSTGEEAGRVYTGKKARAVPVVHVRTKHDPKNCDKSDTSYLRCSCPKYLLWYAEGKIRKEFVKTGDKEVAEQKAYEKESLFRAAAEGKPLPEKANHVSVQKVVTAFLATKQSQVDRGEMTQKHHDKLASELKELVEFCERSALLYIGEVKTAHLSTFTNEWQAASSTFAKRLQRLRTFFDFAIEHEHLVKNPARAKHSLKAPKPEDPKPKALSQEQMEQLFASIPKVNGQTTGEQRTRLRAMMTLMRWTGLALRDALTIERAAFKQLNGSGFYSVTGRRHKTGKPFYGTITGAVMKEILAGAIPNGRYLFVPSVPEGERELDKLVQTWGSLFAKLGEVANLKDENDEPLSFTSHWMRHSFVRWALDQQMSTEEVAYMIGDTVPVVARHYSLWIEASRERVVDRMKRALGQVAAAAN